MALNRIEYWGEKNNNQNPNVSFYWTVHMWEHIHINSVKGII